MAKLLGLGSVLNNLNREINNIQKRSLKGLIESAILIIRDMEKVPPKIPVDTGNLRNSRFLVTSEGQVRRGQSPRFKGNDAGELYGGHGESINRNRNEAVSKGLAVILGFTANYAWAVHEDTTIVYKRPGSGAKFFEAALKRNILKILIITAKEAQI
jgi:hypothetical protein